MSMTKVTLQDVSFLDTIHDQQSSTISISPSALLVSHLQREQTVVSPSPDTSTLLGEHTLSMDVVGEVSRDTTSRDDAFHAFHMSELLGEGGMGQVWEAHQEFPERYVAIKRLKLHHVNLAKILLQEANVMGKLEHPNIPPVHLIYRNEYNTPDVVMKLIEGRNLSEILQGQAQKNTALLESLQVVKQVCHAMEFAHSKGFVHRDIKPENIRVGEFNQVYVMDWGLVVDMNNPSLTFKGLAGSPAYMAPEMISGDPMDIGYYTDVYLLGATLYQIITGEVIHRGKTVQETLQQIAQEKSIEFPTDVPKELAQICIEACAHSTTDRLQTVQEFRSKIDSFLEHWQAIKLWERATALIDTYKVLLHDGARNSGDDFHMVQAGIEAKFALEQALDSWPEYKEAQESWLNIVSLIAQRSLDGGDITYVEVLLAEIQQRFPKKQITGLEEKLSKAKEQKQREEERNQKFSQMEQDFDPNQSQSSRWFLQRFLVISTTFSILVLSWSQAWFGLQMKGAMHFYSMLVTILPMLLVIVWRHKQFSLNTFGRQSMRTVVMGGTALLANRAISVLEDGDPSAMVTRDIFIIGLSLANATPSIKNGPKIAIANFFLGSIAIWLPLYAREIFYLVAVTSAVGISLEWRYMQEDAADNIDGY